MLSNFKNRVILLVALILACAYFLLYEKCNKNYKNVYKTIDSTTTIIKLYDSTKHEIITYADSAKAPELKKIDTVYIHKWFVKSVNQPIAVIDTQAIINLWLNSTYFYEQNIIDSDITATIDDSIYQNKIVYRDFKVKITRPEQITINTIIKKPTPTTHYYAGGEAEFSRVANQLRIGFMYQAKNQNIIGLHYDVLQPNFNISINYHYQLK